MFDFVYALPRISLRSQKKILVEKLPGMEAEHNKWDGHTLNDSKISAGLLASNIVTLLIECVLVQIQTNDDRGLSLTPLTFGGLSAS